MKIGGHDNYYYERDDERAGEIGGDVGWLQMMVSRMCIRNRMVKLE